jgi:uncharacterized protein involved in type VI secretion and phage assembly
MHRVVNAIRQVARHEVEQHWGPSLGVVTSLHGANGEKRYACTVQLRESGLVLPRVPIATGLIGTAALPREQDLVVVLFVGGDPHAPVVVGRLYSDVVEPPANEPGELVAVLPGDETSPDRRLELRVKTPGDGRRSLRLTLEGSVKVELVVDDGGLMLQAQDTRLRLTQTSGSDGRAELQVGDSKIVVEQGGDVTIEAAGTLKLKASTIEISGDAQVKIAGQTIDLN